MKNDILLKYRMLNAEEVNREIFKDFIRYQNVTKCWRKENGKWIIKDAPFVDDWTENDYEKLIFCLKNTIASDGFVYAAFYDGKLKGLPQHTPLIYKRLDFQRLSVQICRAF